MGPPGSRLNNLGLGQLSPNLEAIYLKQKVLQFVGGWAKIWAKVTGLILIIADMPILPEIVCQYANIASADIIIGLNVHRQRDG